MPTSHPRIILCTMTTSHPSVFAFTATAAAGLALTSLVVLWNKRRHQEREHGSSSDRIYLDYNGTTPVYPEVLRAMTPYFGLHFGNPSSHHWFGEEPRRAVDRARRSLLKLLGAPNTVDSSAIWFTSCGTESDNLAIHLAIQSSSHTAKKHVVTCNIEHAAVDACLQALLERGEIHEITRVPVDEQGRVSAEQVIQAIQPDSTILVTLMLANNEVGTLQPVKPVAEYCRQKGILFHTDAAQAVGKVSVTLQDLGDPDMISLVGHKMGAPKGIAALYVRPGCTEEHDRQLQAKNGIVVIGGNQEFGRRGGTLNVPYIVGMGKAAELVTVKWHKNAKHMQAMKDRLLTKLQELTQDVATVDDQPLIRVNGPADPALVLPNTLSVGLRNIHSGVLLEHVGDQVGVSAGATCHSTDSVSTVLQAMHVPLEYARGTLRLSLGPWTTPQQIDRASVILTQEAKRQWSEQKQ